MIGAVVWAALAYWLYGRIGWWAFLTIPAGTYLFFFLYYLVKRIAWRR